MYVQETVLGLGILRLQKSDLAPGGNGLWTSKVSCGVQLVGDANARKQQLAMLVLNAQII